MVVGVFRFCCSWRHQIPDGFSWKQIKASTETPETLYQGSLFSFLKP